MELEDQNDYAIEFTREAMFDANGNRIYKDTDCLLCVTMIEWLREAWPEEHLDELPEFLPRKREPVVKVHGAAADWMPFCGPCSKQFMQAMSVFHAERQAREGQEQAPLRARVQQGIATPSKQIVLPGQPGFKAP